MGAQALQDGPVGRPLRVALDRTGRGLGLWSSSEGLSWSRFDLASGWQAMPLIRIDDNHQLGAMALGPSGQILAAWIQRYGTGPAATLWTSRGSLDSGFGPPERVDAGDPSADFGNFSEDAALDDRGAALVAWDAFPAFANRFDPARGWQGVAVLSTEPTNGIRVESDSAGNSVLVWQESNRGRVARLRPGETFTFGEDYDPSAAGAFASALALAADGRGVVAWAHDGVRTRMLSSSTSGLGPVAVLAPFARDVRAAAAQGGRAAVAWSQGGDVWASTFDPMTGWQPAESIAPAPDARDYDVGTDSAGNAIVVFGQWNGTRDVAQARRYVRGRGWLAAEKIDISGQSIGPTIAMDPQGNAVVVWLEFAPQTTNVVWANRFDAAAP